jgi:hypothetical protein
LQVWLPDQLLHNGDQIDEEDCEENKVIERIKADVIFVILCLVPAHR